MPILVYDHTALVEPNLLIPGKKPIGPVEVDLSNEFGKHVIAGICQGKRISHDITKHDPLNTGGYELHSGATVRRNNVVCYGDYECALSRNKVTFDNTEPLSFLWRGTFDSSALDAFGYLLYCNQYDRFSLYFNPAGIWYAHSDPVGTLALPDGIPYSLVMADEGAGNTIKLYFSFSSTVLSITSDRYLVTDYLAIGGREDSNSRFSAHEIEMGILLNKAVSEAEARRWMADAYQIVIPIG